MHRNTSISLGSYFDNFIQSRISAGRFKNASEVVRAGLRLLEEEENKMLVLKKRFKQVSIVALRMILILNRI
jgi:antitoxin ParD1/3/4